MLFYQNVITIDKTVHRQTRVAPVTGYNFAARTNAIPLAAVEFAHAAPEYPIAFVRDQDNTLSPVALVGLRNDENLMVDSDGRWSGRYIPAYVRRYPFASATVAGGGDPVLCIDAAWKGFDDPAGEPLFTGSGEPSGFFKNVMALVSDYQGHLQLTGRFMALLDELQLLKPVRVDISAAPDGQPLSFTGLESIDETRLQQLSPDRVQELFADGLLLAVYSQLVSQANFGALGERLAARVTAGDNLDSGS